MLSSKSAGNSNVTVWGGGGVVVVLEMVDQHVSRYSTIVKISQHLYQMPDPMFNCLNGHHVGWCSTEPP